MFPEVITPKSFPEKLQALDYDPLDLMPSAIPPHPRVHITGRIIDETRARLKQDNWTPEALALLEKRCQPQSGKSADPLRNALAFRLTDKPEYLELALRVAIDLSREWLATPFDPTTSWIKGSSEAAQLAMTYDLLSGDATLDSADANLIRDALISRIPALDLCPQHTCSNHNTHNLSRKLSVASALGDRQGIHDTLYGWSGADGLWRYGLIHQLRHDFFADGLHWERTPGYHYYTLMALTRLLDLSANLGIDLWRRPLPALHRDDGRDIHTEYEDAVEKQVQSIFDAPFYQMFSNGDLPLVHDTGLTNLRGVWIWGPLYNLAYEAYQDPKYAWLLNRMEREYTTREHAALPMPLQTHHGDLDFPRVRDTYPKGDFSHDTASSFAPRARHEHGCTLFPVAGCLTLRAQPSDPRAAGAYLFYGPHAAGHQSPAALHVELELNGRRLCLAPSIPKENKKYADPLYRTWIRSTMAHNTVSVDRQSMFPYDDPEATAVFEADTWRDRLSDSDLTLFQVAQPRFKATRAINRHVYPGTLLDRTVIVMPDQILDVFRVISDKSRQLDYALHVEGSPTLQLDGIIPEPQKHEPEHGYRHLRNINRYAPFNIPAVFDFGVGAHLLTLVPPNQAAELLIADDFPTDPARDLGALTEAGPRTCLIIRQQARQTIFAACWTSHAEPVTIEPIRGNAADDLWISIRRTDGREQQWLLPFAENNAIQLG